MIHVQEWIAINILAFIPIPSICTRCDFLKLTDDSHSLSYYPSIDAEMTAITKVMRILFIDTIK